MNKILTFVVNCLVNFWTDRDVSFEEIANVPPITKMLFVEFLKHKFKNIFKTNLDHNIKIICEGNLRKYKIK